MIICSEWLASFLHLPYSSLIAQGMQQSSESGFYERLPVQGTVRCVTALELENIDQKYKYNTNINIHLKYKLLGP